MAKKKVAAIVKIQIPAGKATPGAAGRHRARPARRADHGLRQAVQRGHRDPGRHDHPRRDHRLRGPHVHVHPEDAADAGAAAPEGRAREGLDHAGQGRRSARSPRPTSKRSPRSRCPTSTPTTSRPPSSRCAAPPARWASRSSEPHPARGVALTIHQPRRPGRPRPADSNPEGDITCQARSTPTRQDVRP